MKHLLIALSIGLQAPGSFDALAWSPVRDLRSDVESLVECQWLTAGGDEEQQQQQQQQKSQDDAYQDDEPDCD